MFGFLRKKQPLTAAQTYEQWLAEHNRRVTQYNESIENGRFIKAVGDYFVYAAAREHEAIENGHLAFAAEWAIERQFCAAAIDSLIASKSVQLVSV